MYHRFVYYTTQDYYRMYIQTELLINYFFCLKYYSTTQDIIPPLFCTCPKTGPGVQIPHAMGFLCVWFVDIGGIVHHHCLNFLSIFTNIHLPTFCICYQQTLINNYAPDCVLFFYFHFII